MINADAVKANYNALRAGRVPMRKANAPTYVNLVKTPRYWASPVQRTPYSGNGESVWPSTWFVLAS